MVNSLRQAVTAVFRNWDIILTPSCAAIPWPATEPFPTEIAGQSVGPRGHAIYTGWVNAAGLPALQLPARASPSGLPIGVQLVGAMGTERRLLAWGTQYEAAGGGFIWPKV
jgi:aspartyl-tRNA(Asn)/glutamyl-tRNA(Gln) amidotransferase subunit A